MVQPLAPLEIPDPNAGRRRLIVVVMVVVTLVVGLVAWSFRGTSPEAVVDTTSTSQVEEETTTTTVAEATITDTACTVSEFEISLGDIGESVRCAQIALVAAGYSNVEITGVFDEETDEATREFQTDLELYVDGIISKVTATELGVWPGLEAFIVRTPAPAPGAVDLLGMPLSPVASAGSDAPELPEDAGQGTGKRVVYQRSSQRVWAIDSRLRRFPSKDGASDDDRRSSAVIDTQSPILFVVDRTLGWFNHSHPSRFLTQTRVAVD